MTTGERLKQIEDDLKELKAKKKDIWDKMSAVGVPLVIALVGISIGIVEVIQNARIEETKRHMTTTIEDAKIKISTLSHNMEKNSKTADILSKFGDKLLSPDEREKEFAAAAIRIGAPENGTKFLKEFIKNYGKSGNENIARSIINKRDLLIKQLFNENGEERLQAYTELLSNWESDEKMIDELISFAEQNVDNEDGIYNTLVLLSHMDKSTIQNKRSEIFTFTKIAENKQMGSKINKRVIKLNDRIK